MTGRIFTEISDKLESRRDTEAVDLRPPLTARKEAVHQSARVPGFDVTTSAPGPRAIARHFAAKRSRPAVRPFQFAEPHKRKVIVKVRRVLTTQTTRRLLQRHVAYIQRGAAHVDDKTSALFDRVDDEADTRKFVERCQGDGRHFQLIINPEDGTELGDLKPYARQLMNGVEDDLGGRLDWIAGAHFDTGRPHLHIIMRGRQADGRSLAVPGTYRTTGFRERAQDVATEMLGPGAQRVRSDTIQADRFTPTDRILLQAAKDGRLDADWIPQAFRSDALRRLIHLENRGWATPHGPGIWQIPSTLRQTLLAIGQKNAREVAAAKVLELGNHSDQRSRLVAISPRPGERLVGAYVGVYRTHHYAQSPQAVVLDLTDGRLVHVLMRNTESAMCLDRIPTGAAIEITGLPRNARPADQTVAEIAAERGSIWSVADHAAARPADRPKYIAFHHKRVEAMSLEGACVALGDGRFVIPGDYCDLARQADVAQWGEAEVSLRVLDHRVLTDQVRTIGFTWLDRLMMGAAPNFSGPFGEEVSRALPERAKRLQMTGLGSGDPLVLSDADIHRLTTLEIKSVFETLGRDGKAVFLIASGQQAAGAYKGRVHISGAPYGVLEDRSAINLIPWRPGMEACRGQNLIALVRDGQVDFCNARNAGRDLDLG